MEAEPPKPRFLGALDALFLAGAVAFLVQSLFAAGPLGLALPAILEVSLPTGLVAGTLLAAGVGLSQRRAWGRALALGMTLAAIAFLVALSALGAGSRQALALSTLPVVLALWACAWYLSRPGVRAWFSPLRRSR